MLPVHTFVDDSNLLDKGLKNYWGYNTIGFFAPGSALRRQSRLRLRRVQGDGGAPARRPASKSSSTSSTTTPPKATSSGRRCRFKGIDNASYYRLAPDPRYYINDTGTGNTVNLSNSRVLQMVMDSLRYWASDMRIDGFRFDLATILGREPHGFEEEGRFLDACRQDPALSEVKLIAEPWDMRTGRLSGRALFAGLGRVERRLPRHGAGLLAGRRGQAAALGVAAHRVGRPVRQARPQAMGLGQLHHGA